MREVIQLETHITRANGAQREGAHMSIGSSDKKGGAKQHTRCAPGLFAALLVAALAAGCGGGNETTAPPVAAESQASTATEATAAASAKTLPAGPVTVQGLIPVAVRRITWSIYEFDYRLLLSNSGPAVDGVAVRLAEPERGVQVVDGTVNAGSLAAGAYTVPQDKITIRKGLLPLFVLRPHEWQVTYGPPTLVGTAAVGAALANANVSVTDSTGANVCSQTTVVTNGVGQYTCSVLAGRTAPFLVVVTDPSGAYPPLVSVATTAPAPGTSLVANVTPLTTAIVSRLAPDGNALSVVSNPALIDLTALASITANVLAQIQPVLAAIGAPAGYDPFTTQIVAATAAQGGNTADQVLETLRFTTVAGETRIATVDNPAGSVPLAGAGTTAPPALPAPSPTLLSLNDSMRLIVSSLTDCFALPVSARVLSVDTSIPVTEGGRSVTGMAAACQKVTHPDYLTSGYRFGQRYYGLLNDTAMVGAQFMPAEIMLFIEDTTAADNDVAVLNVRYVDANGNIGNLIEVARKLPGSATAANPSDWWLHGNRRPVDASIRAFTRRNEQLAPNPGTAPFTNAGASRYEAGLEVFVNKDGPGSVGLRAARVTGPGLPPAGLVYTRPSSAIVTDQNWLNVRRKDGLTDATSATPAGDVGNIFRVQRTQGLVGAAATAVQPNPNAGNGNNTQFPNWAHPLDYGAPVGSTSYIDFAQLGAFNVYTFEIFYDGETTARHTFTARTLTPVVPATYAGNLRWLSLTPATLGFLTLGDPQATPQTTVGLAWTANPFAETISSAGVFTFGGGQSVADPVVPVARGATSATAVAPSGTPFPALSGDGTSSRTIQLRYRMLDGSYKDATTRFN